MDTLPPPPEMERAYLQSDTSYDGIFFLGVRSTGIFCRPTCPARKALPKYVEYFATPKLALAAGYRACKRCHPLENDGQPRWALDLIAEIEAEPTVRITETQLRARGIDPATVRRYFLRQFGMTFMAFSRAHRLTNALHRIRQGCSTNEVGFESGYESLSGFQEAFTQAFGATPAQSRDRDCIRLEWIRSPLGPLVAGANSQGVCLLEFTDRRMLATQFATIAKRFDAPVVPGAHPHLDQLRGELDAYFAGTLQKFAVPLIYPGTPFQEKVWRSLLEIPYGETRSYEDMAIAVGCPKAVRAVGTTNGLNRIAIVIPCHRVVNKNGQLGGYGGGLRRKEFLLALERKALEK